MDTVMRMGNFYWLLSGALLGFGLIGVFSIGIPFFFLGAIMTLYGIRRRGGKGFGLVLVGMGAVPALYLIIRSFTDDRASTFYPDNFWVIIVVFVALSAGGAILFLIDTGRSKHEK
jgi:hypothetical protein